MIISYVRSIRYICVFQDLIEDLKSELSGHFEDTVLALMTPKIDYYARELHRAVVGMGTNETTLIEILCSVSNDEMQAITRTYRSSKFLLFRIKHSKFHIAIRIQSNTNGNT